MRSKGHAWVVLAMSALRTISVVGTTWRWRSSGAPSLAKVMVVSYALGLGASTAVMSRIWMLDWA
jgi:hypothetical protein